MTDVLVCGSTAIDFLFTVDAFPDRPEKYRAADAAIVGGGCAGNAAVAIARLGGRARLAARCGQDMIGRMTCDDLEDWGVDTSLVVRTPGGRSAYSSILVDPAGERQIVAFRGEKLAERLDRDLGKPSAVLADTRWPEAAMQVFAHARTLGIPAVLDGEAPVSGTLAAAATHVAFSAQGLAEFTATRDLSEGLARATRRTGAWVCVTDGAAGTLIAGAGGPERIPAPQVAAVDTLGAGDVWHGAFALALAEGRSERAAVVFANATASLKCTRPGGRQGAPTRAEVDEFMQGAD
ncbi:sugar kinase [Rhodobacteraceae bacterium 2CG4]|uniref:Sugar kinase n=1 Tax=Halovulum marinum TaxID=2662447 RepID=A0A6L5Z1Y0_9RHOB|nr:PfkB family carbohydrate kinase [Halovulum marinum]MSU90576.1 sugar kinase [Halovulum marinum]